MSFHELEYLENLLFENELFKSSHTGLEAKLRRWAKPPSKTEIEKCDRALRMVSSAINTYYALKSTKTRTFTKGSFVNRTNIPSDSDVDVGVVNTELFKIDSPPGYMSSHFGFVDAAYTYPEFKNDVFGGVKSYFGDIQVSQGNKSIKVHSNSSRMDADVVPFSVYRKYDIWGNYSEGVALRDSSGNWVINFPDQNYANGVRKNKETKQRYKALVRIIKNIKKELKDQGVNSTANAASFLIESLCYNIPNYYFDDPSYTKMTTDCLIYLKSQLSDLSNVILWKEVNGIKDLFSNGQSWTSASAYYFISDALTYMESQE